MTDKLTREQIEDMRETLFAFEDHYDREHISTLCDMALSALSAPESDRPAPDEGRPVAPHRSGGGHWVGPTREETPSIAELIANVTTPPPGLPEEPEYTYLDIESMFSSALEYPCKCGEYDSSCHSCSAWERAVAELEKLDKYLDALRAHAQELWDCYKLLHYAEQQAIKRAEAAEARERAAREALQQFAECNLNDSNCASLEVATARIRNIARAALRAGEKA